MLNQRKHREARERDPSQTNKKQTQKIMKIKWNLFIVDTIGAKISVRLNKMSAL